MPIQVDSATAHDIAPRIDEALDIVSNEFEGLDGHRQYRNAFARALKPDPLGRVAMLGTDQRDLFVPVLRESMARTLPSSGGHIFDFGAGDGQTFALAADSVPRNTRISIEEPNSAYVEDYLSFLRRDSGFEIGVVINGGVEEIDDVAERSGIRLPADGTVDLGLAMHILYFATDLESCLLRLTRFIRPGGELFCVISDERTAFVGQVLREFIQAGGDTGANERNLSVIGERCALLGPADEGGGGMAHLLRECGVGAEVDVIRQESRLYGHSLVDILALSNIGVMVDIPGTFKFESAARVLRDRPNEVDLRIETEGPRMGMWSVLQPQWITRIRPLTT